MNSKEEAASHMVNDMFRSRAAVLSFLRRKLNLKLSRNTPYTHYEGKPICFTCLRKMRNKPNLSYFGRKNHEKRTVLFLLGGNPQKVRVKYN